MAKSPDRLRFEYHLLETQVAAYVRAKAHRIRSYDKNSLRHVVDTGNDLLAVKAMLPHGQFMLWLRSEFDWSERKGRRLRGVANWLRSKTDIMSDLQIDPTAAYHLTAPSVSAEARKEALERAEAGEKITTAVAREIIAASRKKLGIEPKPPSEPRLRGQLAKALEKGGRHWPTREFRKRAQEILDYVDSLTAMQENGRVVDVNA